MCDLDEDVVIEGSELHKHLVNSGFEDLEIVAKDNGCKTELSLADELEGNQEEGTCCDKSLKRF